MRSWILVASAAGKPLLPVFGHCSHYVWRSRLSKKEMKQLKQLNQWLIRRTAQSPPFWSWNKDRSAYGAIQIAARAEDTNTDVYDGGTVTQFCITVWRKHVASKMLEDLKLRGVYPFSEILYHRRERFWCGIVFWGTGRKKAAQGVKGETSLWWYWICTAAEACLEDYTIQLRSPRDWPKL